MDGISDSFSSYLVASFSFDMRVCAVILGGLLFCFEGKCRRSRSGVEEGSGGRGNYLQDMMYVKNKIKIKKAQCHVCDISPLIIGQGCSRDP